ncbi:hypothetical protein SNEBB_002634 [Seison nebaliae]|nr:hypothetical protein SNEBB_002634 [Seison nebaliae]
MPKKNEVTLKTPKGTKDYHGDEMAIRLKVFAIIEECFRRHGAVTIDTPIFELKSILTGKYGDDSKLIYDLADQGGEQLSLRYDLTVPFARYVAMNKLQAFRRYHIGKVYRRDTPRMTKGRYREFYQCDFDIAGLSDRMLADSECLRIVHEILTELQLTEFEIKVNHRLILDGMLEICGVSEEKFRTICSSIDKLDKEDWSTVKKEIMEEKGLTEDVANRIGEFVKLNGKVELIHQLQKNEEFKNNEKLMRALDDMELLFSYSHLMRCDDKLKFDLSLARGLDYYTGCIYEAVLSNTLIDSLTNQLESTTTTGQPMKQSEEEKKKKKREKKKKGGETEENDDEKEEGRIGSVAAGGRYDGLVGMFDAKGKSVPCVGVSLGIERLLAVVTNRERARDTIKSFPSDVYVAVAHRGIHQQRLSIITKLWDGHIRAMQPPKEAPKLLAQFQFCENNRIPLALVLGEDELKEGKIKLRHIQERKEELVPLDDIVNIIKKELKNLKE